MEGPDLEPVIEPQSPPLHAVAPAVLPTEVDPNPGGLSEAEARRVDLIWAACMIALVVLVGILIQ